eukprot:762128-Hanusia_phi.AAC.19
MPSQYSSYPLVLLLLGYAFILLLAAIASRFLSESTSDGREAEDEVSRSFLSLRSTRNAAKRWWDIKGVAPPRQQLGAPRIRLAAGTRARAEVRGKEQVCGSERWQAMRRRFFSSWPGALALRVTRVVSACFCGRGSTANPSYLPVDEVPPALLLLQQLVLTGNRTRRRRGGRRVSTSTSPIRVSARASSSPSSARSSSKPASAYACSSWRTMTFARSP